jgi:UDP-2,3-diacylglucosamine pyrophosphatase LpxH
MGEGMFSYKKRIDKAYRAAQDFPLNDASKVVIMSDCHRGSGNLADDYAKNETIYYAALRAYDRQKYTYIELGDGDELWECRSMTEITAAHKDIFQLLAHFYHEDRLFMLYGNHDIRKKYDPMLMSFLLGESGKTTAPLFPGIRFLESLRLSYGTDGYVLFLLHGHQADFLNDTLWRLARFLVRYVWQPLELIGFSDPTSAAKNNKTKEKVEKRLLGWAEAHGMPLMAGHTHRPVFPDPPTGKYFNDGCCVHPYGINAVEISLGSIALVRWGEMTREDGTLFVGKEIVAGPCKLKDYFI